MNNTINSQLRTGLASSQFSDQFERGHSFSWKGEWQAGVKYFCNDEVTDFVTCDNTILVCRKTHTSDGANRPVIEGTDVAGELWEIALQNSADYSSGMCCDDIINSITANTDTLVEIISKLDDILDKMNSEPQHIVTHELRLFANKTTIEVGETVNIVANYITFIGGIQSGSTNVTEYVNWHDSDIQDGEFLKTHTGSYTVNASYEDVSATITIEVVEAQVERYLNFTPSMNKIEVTYLNCSWTASASEDWVELIPYSGQGSFNPRSTEITVSGNESYESKIVTVTFQSQEVGIKTCNVTVSGKARPSISLNKNSLNFDASGNTQSVTVTINNGTGNEWTVSGTVSGFSYSRSGNTLNVTASATETARSGQYTISYPEANPVTLTVSQSAPVVSNTIYYGFAASAADCYNNTNGYCSSDTALPIEDLCTTNGMEYFYCLVPVGVTVRKIFKFEGYGYVMVHGTEVIGGSVPPGYADYENATINLGNKTYEVYRSGEQCADAGTYTMYMK